MIRTCGSQLRAGFGGAYALDFGAVMSVGNARRVDAALLSSVLEGCETAILNGLQDDAGEGGDGTDDT